MIRISRKNCSKNLLRSETFVFTAFVCLLLPLLQSCEKKSDEIVDSQGAAPSLLSAQLSPTVIDTDTIQIGPTPKPEDVLKLETTLSARVGTGAGTAPAHGLVYSIRRQFQSTQITSGSLPESGVGIFSGKASFEIKRSEVGTMYVEFVAEGDGGFRSNSIILPLRIVRLNRPPVLSDLQAPDTVTLGSQEQHIRLRVNAVDPDGQDDIQRVFFNSFLPDGRPSSNNPFQLFDNGDLQGNGDETKGDSVYSAIIKLPPNTATGTYRFEFQAFDRLNEGSNIITHRLTVKQ